MKKTLLLVLALACILCLAVSAGNAEEVRTVPPEGDEAEWTVLFYLCGSDLEDSFMRCYTLPRFAFDWDGEKNTISDETAWEGIMTLN